MNSYVRGAAAFREDWGLDWASQSSVQYSRRTYLSTAGFAWVDAGGNEIKRKGKATVRTDSGTMKRGVFKVGQCRETLISVDRLQKTGHDVILTKNKPRIVNLRTGEVMPLRQDEGMFILNRKLRTLHGRGKSSQQRPCKSMIRSGRQTGCWRRMHRHHEPR